MYRVHLRKFYCIYCAEDCSPATSEQRGMSPHTPSGHLGCRHSVPGPHTGAPRGLWGLASRDQPASPASQDARSQRLTNKPSLQPALSPAAGAFVLESPGVSCDPQKPLTLPASFPRPLRRMPAWRYQNQCCSETVQLPASPTQACSSLNTPSPGALCAGLPLSLKLPGTHSPSW